MQPGSVVCPEAAPGAGLRSLGVGPCPRRLPNGVPRGNRMATAGRRPRVRTCPRRRPRKMHAPRRCGCAGVSGLRRPTLGGATARSSGSQGAESRRRPGCATASVAALLAAHLPGTRADRAQRASARRVVDQGRAGRHATRSRADRAARRGRAKRAAASRHQRAPIAAAAGEAPRRIPRAATLDAEPFRAARVVGRSLGGLQSAIGGETQGRVEQIMAGDGEENRSRWLNELVDEEWKRRGRRK